MEVSALAAVNMTEFPEVGTSTAVFTTTTEPGRNTLFDYGEGMFLTVLLGILCVFGLVANLITFFTIATSKALLKSPFNILIMSLSVSDFLSALVSPLQVYRRIWGYLEWELSVGVCKLTVGVVQWTTFVTIQHILVFSLFRLLAIMFPHRIKKFNVKAAKIVAIFVWVEAFLAGSLFYIIASTVVPYSPGRYKTACTGVAKSWRPAGEKYAAVAVPILMFVPFIIIVICAIIITGALIQIRWKRAHGIGMDSDKVQPYGTGWESDTFPGYKELEVAAGRTMDQRQEQENAALLQVTLIVFSFLFGYSIDAAYRMTKALDMRSLFTLRSKWLTIIISYVCLRLSECLNPLFYNLASSQMRESTRKFLRIRPDMGSNGSGNSSSSGKKTADTHV